MPRYRVVLEFDHPGQGAPSPEPGRTDMLNGPDRWRWDRKLDAACEDIHVEVFEQAPWHTLQIHDYERGAG